MKLRDFSGDLKPSHGNLFQSFQKTTVKSLIRLFNDIVEGVTELWF